ncbi:hypothetical protein [Natronococcus pandeyae]|nr:hypothetical protein [Natronococcus pandeyae]
MRSPACVRLAAAPGVLSLAAHGRGIRTTAVDRVADLGRDGVGPATV